MAQQKKELGRKHTSVLTNYVKAFEDKTAKQQFELNHSQASTCLPSTAGGTHPALVLIRQKALLCGIVCQERVDNCTEILAKMGEHMRVESIAVDNEDANKDGRIDQNEFKVLLMQQIAHMSEKGYCEDLLEEQVDVLMHFVPLDKDCLVADVDEPGQLKAKLKLVLTLWCLVSKYRTEWLKRVRVPIRKVQLLEALTALNQGERVEMREAIWLREKFWSIHCEHAVDETKLLLCLAYWYSAPQARPLEGLNRNQLVQRIELERRLWNGLYRFILWVGVFILLAVSLIIAGELERCRGIKGNLETQLRLEDSAHVTTMKEVIAYAKEFSKLSANLAPLSRVYFGGGSVWNLQDELKTFQAPVPLPYLMEPDPNDEGQVPEPLVIGNSFTLQAWVQFGGVALPANGVSLLRKALGSDSALSCWNWRFPPALSFGAHDYGSEDANPLTGLMEDYVATSYPQSMRQEGARSVLHTVLVTPDHVTFMVDDRVLGRETLTRPVTDCFSLDITVGDRGLTLAAVRYYPRELTSTEVAQIFRAGSTWRDIGHVISPQKLKGMSETETMAKTLRESIDGSEATVKSTEDATWTAGALTTASLRSGQAVSPYVNTNHPITERLADPSLGYRYWEVYTTPLYTNALSKNLAHGLSLPPQPGRTGLTLSAWIKVDSNTGSGYFMAPSMPRFDQASVAAGSTANPEWTGIPNMCWMIWVGASYTGFYTKSGVPGVEDGPTYFVEDLRGPSGWQFTAKSYRHFVFQIAPEDTERPLRVCIDGVCTGQAAIDKYARLDNQSFPPAASCAQTGIVQSYSSSFAQGALNQSRLYLNRRPLDSFPMSTWQMQTKYFDRVLTEAEIKNLFENDPDPNDPSGRPIRATVGCKLPTELKDDPLFRDDFGNNCYWYFQSKRTRPTVCSDPTVKQACPVACEAFEICWGAEAIQGGSFQIWRQQMEFQTRGPHGTMCVANSTTPEAEAIKCALNAPNHTNCHTLKARGEPVDCEPRDCSAFASDRQGLVQCLGNTRWVPDEGSRYDYFVPCKDIVLLSMPSCTWDDTGLDEVGTSITASQSWSISFWYESSTEDFCAEPQVRLLDGDGSTFSWMGAMDGLVEDVQAGPGWLSGCSTERWLSHGPIAGIGHRGGTAGTMSADVAAVHAAPGSKHFVVIGRRPDSSIGLHLDERENTQFVTGAGLRPLKNGSNFLRVINIGGKIRMSPMTLRPYFPSVGEVGHMRFTSQVSQDMRRGPRVPLQAQLAKKLNRKPKKYAQKTMMLIPPLLLQKRNLAGDCQSDFSQRIVSMIYQQGLDSQCKTPYNCVDYNQQDVYTCPRNEDATEEHFGHPALTLGQDSYYMEYLASIADNSVLVRNHEVNGQRQLTVRRTDDFLDLLTKEVTILALFYSIEFDITSMLRIHFDTSKGRVLMKSKIEHFVAVRGAKELEVMVFLIIALVFLFLVVADLVPSTRKQMKVYRQTKRVHWASLGESLGDACLGACSFAVVLVQLLLFKDSNNTMKDFVTTLAGFDWAGGSYGSQDLSHIKQEFLNEVSKIQDAFSTKSDMTAVSTILSIVLLLRVVYCTSAHPRIELITKTIELAASDLLHFFALLMIIFSGFAVLGTWMFGAEREEFRGPLSAFMTLCDSVLGPPGLLPIGDPNNTNVEVLYVFLFHSICFFFMLNFILAIIVDSYTRVMEGVRECVVDQNILSDVMSIFRYQYLLWKWKFPLRRVVKVHLNGLDMKVVTQDDLFGNAELEGQEIFASREAAEAYFKHYERYDFLRDDAVEPTNPSSGDLAMIMALTMHKVEMLQNKLEERGDAPSLSRIGTPHGTMLDHRRPSLCSSEVPAHEGDPGERAVGTEEF